ncbi:MAG TPA: hypothetical protein DD381_04355 [Lentisphaeria bacterium]|nr:MAG: hypothetical protein A2X47_07295 [Lentisphaerae bacterium GWF2_38_69]HBM15564.1 hypothetical protein [Lentisphaeria bacterium]
MINRIIAFFITLFLVLSISTYAEKSAPDEAIDKLQKAGISADNEGLLILKRYSYYFSEIRKGNAFGHTSLTGYKKAPPIYDYIAFSVVGYKGTINKIVENTIAGKDAFEGITGLFERAYKSDTEPQIDSYLIYLPTSYDKEKQYPLVIFLHGSCENVYMPITATGHQPFIEACENQRFILIAPNGKCHYDSTKPKDGLSDYMGIGEDDILNVIKNVRGCYNINEKQIYLTGCSLGGFGSWYIGSRHTDIFAAIAPCCGIGMGIKDDEIDLPSIDVNKLKNTPVYVFHGNIDPIVPVTDSRQMVQKLKEIGADVTYEEFPGVGHNAWDYAYNNDRLLQWFLKNSKE